MVLFWHLYSKLWTYFTPFSSVSLVELEQVNVLNVNGVPISGFLVHPLETKAVIQNCHNSITNHNIGMKLGPVTKLDKRNTATSKKFDNDIMSANCDVIVFFPIYGQLAAIQKPDSRCMVYKTYIFINSNFSSSRTWNSTKKSLTQLL